jgi:hypothetical protein
VEIFSFRNLERVVIFVSKVFKNEVFNDFSC